MKKVINCYKENNPIINEKLKEVSVEEGLEIATELFQILNKRGDGIGLAANQVGINAQVAVLNVREPIILINPKVEEAWDEVDFYEGCLSYPEKGIHTKRYKNIIVKSEHLESGMYFSGNDVPTDGTSRGTWEATKKQDKEERLLEAVCVQHEIDHLMGKTIHDRKIDTTIKVEKKIGRNNLVTIKKGDAVKVLKYKKAKPLLDSGGWIMN